MKIDQIVEQMKPMRWTRAQAAKAVGRDPDTLKRWKREGTFVPSDSKMFGKVKVDLYTAQDIRAMRQLARTMKPGRKPANDHHSKTA